jgi:hypothetical protein
LKKAGFIFFSLLLTVLFSGHFFIYKVILNQHKKEFKAYLRTQLHNIEVIEIVPSELYADSKNITWHDENKEVEKDGEMYDIVKIESKGAKVLIHAVADKAEKELKKEFERQAGQENYGDGTNKPAQKSSHVLKDLLALKFMPCPHFKFSGLTVSSRFYTNSPSETSPGFTSICSPPPNI